MQLKFLEGEFSVCRLSGDSEIPEWIAGEFQMMCRTNDEMTVVCRRESVPATIDANEPWVGFFIDQELSFDQLGIIARLSEVLASADISVFVVSTFRTDYVFVSAHSREHATETLRSAGYRWV